MNEIWTNKREVLKSENKKLVSKLKHFVTWSLPTTKNFKIQCTTITCENEFLESKANILEKVVKNFILGSKGLNMVLSNKWFAKAK